MIGLNIPRGRKGDRGYLRVLMCSGLHYFPPRPQDSCPGRDTVRDSIGEAEPFPPVRSHPLKPEHRVPFRRDLGDLGLLKTTANTARGGQESQSLPEPRKAS